MSIRLKIIFLVLPLLTATLIISGMAASLASETGITRLAMDFLSFKAEEVRKSADTQWNLLVRGGLQENQDLVQASQRAIQSFAQSVVRSPTELIFALGPGKTLPLATRTIQPQTGELDVLEKLPGGQWTTFTLESKVRVGQVFNFEAFGWKVFVSEERDTFYQGVRELNFQNLLILGCSLGLALLLLLFFTAWITGPVRRMVKTVRNITQTGNLGLRVQVEYRDEVGRLAQSFNEMLTELEKAYQQIKTFAFQSVMAQKTEQKIRALFQKYVPASVIDTVFANPQALLVGENRELSILFSDIRSFTTISETMSPEELVTCLNRYFSAMVDVIMTNGGTVDKYIGDAIMAIFGAPVKTENDALLSVLAALQMLEALQKFNQEQKAKGQVEFAIGIGIHHGLVTVGNIGSEKKMNYTVIGDGVNLASRLEGLTKHYHQPLIFSEAVYQKVGRVIPCRMLDKVQVKGKTTGEAIYTARASLSDSEKRGWALHHTGLEAYYDRKWDQAKSRFQEALSYLPGDYLLEELITRCERYKSRAPGADWTGVEIMTEK